MEVPALAAWLERLPDLCVFKRLTGYPCAGCGMTRAFVSILSGDLYAAWHYNALSIPLFLALSIGAVWSLADHLRRRDSLRRFTLSLSRHKVWLYTTLCVLVALNWVWNIAKGI